MIDIGIAESIWLDLLFGPQCFDCSLYGLAQGKALQSMLMRWKKAPKFMIIAYVNFKRPEPEFDNTRERNLWQLETK